MQHHYDCNNKNVWRFFLCSVCIVTHMAFSNKLRVCMVPGMNGEIRYSLSGGRNLWDLFTIDAKTGVLSSAGSLDRELQGFYNIPVVATDMAFDEHARLSSTTVVRLLCSILVVLRTVWNFSLVAFCFYVLYVFYITVLLKSWLLV